MCSVFPSVHVCIVFVAGIGMQQKQEASCIVEVVVRSRSSRSLVKVQQMGRQLQLKCFIVCCSTPITTDYDDDVSSSSAGHSGQKQAMHWTGRVLCAVPCNLVQYVRTWPCECESVGPHMHIYYSIVHLLEEL